MKFSAMIVGAFAALALAAPAPEAAPSAEMTTLEARRRFDAGSLNNFRFNQQDLNYLLNINSLDLGLFQRLGVDNNFNLLLFQGLFNVQSFNIQQLLQLQSLNTLLAIAGTGVFNTFDLSVLNPGFLNLGLINGINGVGLGQFIDAGLVPQIAGIASGGTCRETREM